MIKSSVHQPQHKGLAGLLSGIFGKRKHADSAATRKDLAVRIAPWKAPQFLALLSLAALPDADVAEQIGQPLPAVRRIRDLIHHFHRDGATARLAPQMLEVLQGNREPVRCAICNAEF